MQVTTDWQVVVSHFPGVWTAEEVTPVVSLAFMEGVSGALQKFEMHEFKNTANGLEMKMRKN